MNNFFTYEIKFQIYRQKIIEEYSKIVEKVFEKARSNQNYFICSNIHGDN